MAYITTSGQLRSLNTTQIIETNIIPKKICSDILLSYGHKLYIIKPDGLISGICCDKDYNFSICDVGESNDSVCVDDIMFYSKINCNTSKVKIVVKVSDNYICLWVDPKYNCKTKILLVYFKPVTIIARFSKGAQELFYLDADNNLIMNTSNTDTDKAITIATSVNKIIFIQKNILGNAIIIMYTNIGDLTIKYCQYNITSRKHNIRTGLQKYEITNNITNVYFIDNLGSCYDCFRYPTSSNCVIKKNPAGGGHYISGALVTRNIDSNCRSEYCIYNDNNEIFHGNKLIRSDCSTMQTISRTKKSAI
jgi:hypothetical protein